MTDNLIPVNPDALRDALLSEGASKLIRDELYKKYGYLGEHNKALPDRVQIDTPYGSFWAEHKEKSLPKTHNVVIELALRRALVHAATGSPTT